MNLMATFGEFHPPTEFFVFMLSHFFSPFFYDTRHKGMIPGLKDWGIARLQSGILLQNT